MYSIYSVIYCLIVTQKLIGFFQKLMFIIRVLNRTIYYNERGPFLSRTSEFKRFNSNSKTNANQKLFET